MTYTVKQGDTIYDVAYNTTGSLAAVDAIMDANAITSYSATLAPGTTLTFDAEIKNNAATLKANRYPYNSTYIPDAELEKMIETFLREIDNDGTAIAFNETVAAFDETVPVMP